MTADLELGPKCASCLAGVRMRPESPQSRTPKFISPMDNLVHDGAMIRDDTLKRGVIEGH